MGIIKPIIIKSIKHNEKILKLNKKLSNSTLRSKKNSFISNASMSNSESLSKIQTNKDKVFTISQQPISSERINDYKQSSSKGESNKSHISTDKNTLCSPKQKTRNNKSINIQNKKIYTTINQYHLASNNNRFSTINNEIIKEVKKLTHDFANGIIQLNQQCISNYLQNTIKGKMTIIKKNLCLDRKIKIL